MSLENPTFSGRGAWPWLVAAAVLALGGFALGSGEPQRLWSGLLLNGFLLASLGLGSLLFVALQYLTRAGWWVALRRVPEALSSLLPVAALLLLAVFLGGLSLYGWSSSEALRDPLVAAKSGYLNRPFFLLRALVVLALWCGFAVVMKRFSRAQDRSGDGLAEHRRLAVLSAVFVPVFALSFSIASFDWLMSLDPRWYSTIFAVYCFAGLFLGTVAAITLAVVLLAEGGPLTSVVNESHLHDLGKLMFAFATFWAYIWVSQYLLIWYTDIPEEAVFYLKRTRGAWQGLFYLVLLLNWALPFLVLMTRSAKRNPKVLVGVASLVLVGRWLDLFVLIGPPVTGEPRFGLPEVLLAAAGVSLTAGLFRRALARDPVLAANDPYLGESLAHHG
ncbi:MAG: hypothetical protein U0002_06820 [Thermoanaerobaculia bacterium]